MAGGTNSVYFIDSQTGKTYVQKDNGAVRIVVSGTTGIAHLIAQSSVDIEETNLTGKGFDHIVVDRPADGTITVNIAGVNIESLTVNSANTNIVTNASTSIGSFVANAAVNVTGDGKISNAMINASGVRLAKAPTQQTVAAGVSAPVVSTTGTGSSGGSGGSNLVPVYAIAAIIGTAQVGGVLTAGTLTPAGATVSYQWVICDTIDGIYTNIPGATTDQYTPVAGDANKFIKVVATGTGSYSGIVTSAATGSVATVTSVTSTLSGWVNSSQAVAEANLTVYDSVYGTVSDTVYDTVCKRVYTPGSSTTSEYGSFIIAVDNLPSDFRIVAQGGNCGGEAFPGELMADYRNFNPENDRVYINIVTTMVSVYLDKHPYVTLDKAVEVMKKFLNIPECLDLGRDLQSTNEYFSPGVFVNEAGGNNNIREYIEQLVAEIDSGEGVTHSFPKEKALNGPAWDATKWVAEKLAGSAVSYAGGQVMGWGLKECGLEFEKDDGNAKAIEEMKQELNQMNSQLDNLNANLNVVKDNLSRQLEQVKDEIVLQQLKSEFDTRSGQMTTLAQNIIEIRDEYLLFLDNTPQDPILREAKREHLKNLIRDNLVIRQGVINSQLVGDGMTVPLLDLWARIVQYNHRFLSAGDGDYPSIQAMIDYYKVLQTWQLELVVEYYHAIGEGENYHFGIDSAIEKYNGYMQAQENKAVTPIPENVLIDKLLGIMISEGEDSIYNGIQTKSPWHGNCFASEDKMRNMNSSSYLSFNNWRHITKDEQESVFFGGGASSYPSVWQYLESSGWSIPVNHEMSCASAPVFTYPYSNAVGVAYWLSSTSSKTSTTSRIRYWYEEVTRVSDATEWYWIFCRNIDKSEKYFCK